MLGVPTWLEYRLARAIAPGEPQYMDGSAYAGRSKLRTLVGERILEEVRGRRVIDFGCGEGLEAVELAREGAVHVTGVDLQGDLLTRAREHATAAGVADRCTFVEETREPADVVISIDSFEHFSDPSAVLQVMHTLLVPGGRVFASFGPTWYHPLGGHLFSIFPWAHLVLSEEALIRWRNDIRSDGATRFAEVAGGLNQVTIAGFERLVQQSPFEIEWLECVPIRKLQPLHSRATREWTTAIVRCSLRKGSIEPAL